MSRELELETEQRLGTLLRLIGVVAHDLGATMIPSVKRRGEGEPSKDWKRLAFQTEALSDHVKRQKSALDFFRAKDDSQLDEMEIADWKEWVWPMVTSVLPKELTVALEAPDTGAISPEASHQLLVVMTAYGLQADEGEGLVVSLEPKTAGKYEVTFRVSGRSQPLQLPPDSAVSLELIPR